MKRLALILIAVCAAFTVEHAQAQAIYRCGQTYSQVPCPDGRIIDSSDPRTAAQRAEAKRVAIKERQLAAKLEKERRAQAAEAAASAQPAASLTVRPEPVATKASAESRHKPKSKSKKRKPAADDDFVATVPDQGKAGRK